MVCERSHGPCCSVPAQFSLVLKIENPECTQRSSKRRITGWSGRPCLLFHTECSLPPTLPNRIVLTGHRKSMLPWQAPTDPVLSGEAGCRNTPYPRPQSRSPRGSHQSVQPLAACHLANRAKFCCVWFRSSSPEPCSQSEAASPALGKLNIATKAKLGPASAHNPVGQDQSFQLTFQPRSLCTGI